jgi:hypothetical protein
MTGTFLSAAFRQKRFGCSNPGYELVPATSKVFGQSGPKDN